MIKTRNKKFVYLETEKMFDEAEIYRMLHKLTLIYFIKIPKSDDEAFFLIEVFL